MFGCVRLVGEEMKEVMSELGFAQLNFIRNTQDISTFLVTHLGDISWEDPKNTLINEG